LSETKLNNFPEVDVFVIISCPFHSLFDTKVFYKTIIIAFELELVLEDRTWGNYILTDPTQVYAEEVIKGEPKTIDDSEGGKKHTSLEDQLQDDMEQEEKKLDEDCPKTALVKK
jgi:diphthamide biosynthesis protein 2